VPFCHLTFSATRPPERRYERVKVPTGTLGAAFRERRWIRELDQRAAAEEIGVSVATFRGWETNQTTPAVIHLPAAIAFLGYDWRNMDGTFSNRLRIARTAAGLTIRQLAGHLCVDPSTLQEWEANAHIPSRRHRVQIEDWLNNAPTGETRSRLARELDRRFATPSNPVEQFA
jgi:DNA-binding transcriptional regulator YiaG